MKSGSAVSILSMSSLLIPAVPLLAYGRAGRLTLVASLAPFLSCL